MLFLLQEDGDKDKYSIDNLLLKRLIENSHQLHEYISIKLDDFFELDFDDNGKIVKTAIKNKEYFPEKFKDAVPLGTIEFVQAYFKIFFGIEKEYPLEIPEVLRTDEFLKRKYKIVTADNLPRVGNYFIKDVSKSKEFSYTGNLEFFLTDEVFEKPKGKFDTTLHIDKSHLYQVSEVVPIISEYRAFVVGGKLYSITNYDGDPGVFPDMNLVNKAITLFSLQENAPKSFNIDLAVTPRGTMILEMHLISSIGLYSTVMGSDFLYGYADAKDYVINHNHEITEFDNFSTFKLKNKSLDDKIKENER